MKTLKQSIVSLIAAAAVTTLTSLPASAATMSKSMERNLISVCSAIKSNSKLKLQSRLKRAGLDYQYISDDLICNGKSAIEFADMHNADQTAEIINARSRTNSRNLTARTSG